MIKMWIRSQDKEVLTKVIDIYKQADTNEIWAYSDKGIKNCLGFYATKERAIEVLDEIDRYKNKLEKAYFLGMEESEFVSSTFQMPKE